jgi:hypothetical protein
VFLLLRAMLLLTNRHPDFVVHHRQTLPADLAALGPKHRMRAQDVQTLILGTGENREQDATRMLLHAQDIDDTAVLQLGP